MWVEAPRSQSRFPEYQGAQCEMQQCPMNKGIFVQIGQRIGQKRRAYKMSQRELASRVGVTVQQIEAYEKADCEIPAEHLWSIAMIQSVPVKYYIEEYQEQKIMIEE